jgi:hypothetical protein
MRNSEKGYGKICTGGCFVISAAESVVMKIFNELNGGNIYAVRYADNNILIGNFIGELEVLPVPPRIFRQWCDKTHLLFNINQIRELLKMFCNAFYTSIKINRNLLQCFLWLMLNVLLDTAAPQNAKLSRACAGVRQNVVYGDVRFKQRSVSELCGRERMSKTFTSCQKCVRC